MLAQKTTQFEVIEVFEVYIYEITFHVFLKGILYHSPMSSMVIGYPHTPPILVIIRGNRENRSNDLV